MHDYDSCFKTDLLFIFYKILLPLTRFFSFSINDLKLNYKISKAKNEDPTKAIVVYK